MIKFEIEEKSYNYEFIVSLQNSKVSIKWRALGTDTYQEYKLVPIDELWIM